MCIYMCIHVYIYISVCIYSGNTLSRINRRDHIDRTTKEQQPRSHHCITKISKMQSKETWDCIQKRTAPILLNFFGNKVHDNHHTRVSQSPLRLRPSLGGPIL